MDYRCPRNKGNPVVNLEICLARKARKHYGCVTCRVPVQKRRERKALDDQVLAVEIIRGAIKATPRKKAWAFKLMGVTA